MGSEILEEASEDTLGRVGWSNFFQAIENLCRAPGCEYRRERDLTWYRSGVPYSIFNGVLAARLDPSNADARIKEIWSQNRDRGLGTGWFIDEESRPADLGHRLEVCGFTRDNPVPAMVMDLQGLPDRGPNLGDVIVEEVRDMRDFNGWMEALRVSYEFSDSAIRRYADILTAVGFGEGTDWRHYVARLEDRPVAMASLFLGAEVAGIYNVGTVPDARRRGIGRATTLAAIRDARRQGHHYIVLQASEMGYPVYAKLGFREVSRIAYYAWRLPETATS